MPPPRFCFTQVFVHEMVDSAFSSCAREVDLYVLWFLHRPSAQTGVITCFIHVSIIECLFIVVCPCEAVKSPERDLTDCMSEETLFLKMMLSDIFC